MSKQKFAINIEKYREHAEKIETLKEAKKRDRIGSIEDLMIERKIIDITFALKIAMLQGATKTNIMHLEIDNYDEPERLFSETFDPSWLRGIAAAVYDFCVMAGLSPTVDIYRAETDGHYFNSLDIVIHW